MTSLKGYKPTTPDRAERQTLHARIREELELGLISGRFRPGDRLTLRALAQQLGTSLVPVRDALLHLQSTGALEHHPVNGTARVPKPDERRLQALGEIRLTLEGLAAEHAILAEHDDTSKRLRHRLSVMMALHDDQSSSDYLQANWNFHLEIALLSNMPDLVQMLRSVWLKIGPSVQISLASTGGRRDALQIHERIVIAIEQRDVHAARQALKADIFYGRPNFSGTVSGDPVA